MSVDALPLFALQVALILLLTQTSGRLLAALGLAAVVGEMLAGIALGPSLLGQLAPAWQHALFPAASLAPLAVCAKTGVMFYMLLSGLDMDFSALRSERRAVLTLTLAGSIVPFLLGAVLAWPLLTQGGLFGPRATPISATIFLGLCFAITALPVLARLLDELGLTQSRLGRWALGASAGSDLLAWVVVAIALSQGELNGLLIPAMLLVGVALRDTPLAAWLRRLRPLCLLLLPIYFVMVGLKTDFSSLLQGGHWGLVAAVLAAALAGKLLAGVVAGRALGLTHADAWRLGLMLNTRGLMELILLEQGRSSGLIGPELHGVLVLMTLITTVMAAPLLRVMSPARHTLAAGQ